MGSVTLQSREPGTYTLRQLCATVGLVQFVLPHIYPVVQYEVYSQEPQLSVEPLAGLSAYLSVCLFVGLPACLLCSLAHPSV